MARWAGPSHRRPPILRCFRRCRWSSGTRSSTGLWATAARNSAVQCLHSRTHFPRTISGRSLPTFRLDCRGKLLSNNGNPRKPRGSSAAAGVPFSPAASEYEQRLRRHPFAGPFGTGSRHPPQGRRSQCAPASGPTLPRLEHRSSGPISSAVAAMDVLTYVGRAITPSHSFRRFNTRFLLSDGSNVFGEPMASEELEDVGWHPIGREALAAFRDVTRFMLARARCARGPRAARHRFFIGPRTAAASAFAARRFNTT